MEGDIMNLSATINGEKIQQKVTTIKAWTDGYSYFLQRFKGATDTIITISDQGLVTGKFIMDDPHKSYTPPTTTSSEAQLLTIRGCLKEYLATDDITWRILAEATTAGLLNCFYPSSTIPTTPDITWIPHWLVNVVEPFTSRQYFLNGKVSFVNGIGQAKFDKIFRVFSCRATDATLEYDWAPDSPISSGTEYQIDHTDVAYGQGLATIYLKTAFTGEALIAYTSETGPVIERGEKCEAYPCWRPLDVGEIGCAVDTLAWALDVFKLWYQITGDVKWQNAIKSTEASITYEFNVTNTDYYLKPGKVTEPVLENGITSYSTRSPVETYVNTSDGLIMINYPSSSGEALFGTWVGDSATFNDSHYLELKLGSDKASQVAIYLDEPSSETSSYDPNKRWKCILWLQGKGTAVDQLETVELRPDDFYQLVGIFWGKSYIDIGDGNPINSGNSAVAAVQTIGAINGKTGTYKNIKLTRGLEGTWYGWAQYLFVASVPALPFDISYQTDNEINFVINDRNANKWSYLLPKTGSNFQTLHLTADLFTTTTTATATDLEAGDYKSILVDAVDNNSEINVEYLGIKKTMPNTIGYRNFSFAYSQPEALKVAIAYMKPMPSRIPLPYAPYIAPFDMHLIKYKVSNLRGAVYTGYQAPWIFQESDVFKNNQVEALATNLQFLRDAQTAYADNTGVHGPFIPIFWWDYRTDYNDHTPNTFGWDKNPTWGGFQYRTISDVARVIYNDPSNVQAKTILIDFYQAIDKYWLDIYQGFPTDFNENEVPKNSQTDPHMVGLLLRSLIYAHYGNFNIIDLALIDKLINQCLDYLNYYHIPSDDGSKVAGTFSPDTTANTWYEYWGGDIMDSLGEMMINTRTHIKVQGVQGDLALFHPRLIEDEIEMKVMTSYGIRTFKLLNTSENEATRLHIATSQGIKAPMSS
jgi:predicted transcriptional regulator with HTH domain